MKTSHCEITNVWGDQHAAEPVVHPHWRRHRNHPDHADQQVHDRQDMTTRCQNQEHGATCLSLQTSPHWFQTLVSDFSWLIKYEFVLLFLDIFNFHMFLSIFFPAETATRLSWLNKVILKCMLGAVVVFSDLLLTFFHDHHQTWFLLPVTLSLHHHYIIRLTQLRSLTTVWGCLRKVSGSNAPPALPAPYAWKPSIRSLPVPQIRSQK